MKVYSNFHSTVWGNRRTDSFRPPLATLTSIQNLGGSQASSPSIDIHSNYVRRTSSSQSKLLQYELTSIQSQNQEQRMNLGCCLGIVPLSIMGVLCVEKLGDMVGQRLRVKSDSIFCILFNSNQFFQITEVGGGILYIGFFIFVYSQCNLFKFALLTSVASQLPALVCSFLHQNGRMANGKGTN